MLSSQSPAVFRLLGLLFLALVLVPGLPLPLPALALLDVPWPRSPPAPPPPRPPLTKLSSILLRLRMIVSSCCTLWKGVAAHKGSITKSFNAVFEPVQRWDG